MAIPTTRTQKNGEIIIHSEKCDGCGLCVSVCKDYTLQLADNKVKMSENFIFGCVACGHCMAICPREAIEIRGRELSADDLFVLPGKESFPSYDQLMNLLNSRRSIREFKNKSVDKALIDRIIAAAATAPMGIPPSDVNVLVLDTCEKVRKFSEDYCKYLESIQWFVSKWFLTLMRPFLSKSNNDLFSRFIKPLFKIYIGSMKKGEDLVTYDAPVALYFYGSPYCDPADPLIAATYAMIAGEALGLGTCMLGGIHPLIQYGRKGEQFRKIQGIRYASREGLFVIFGFPKVKYFKGVHRTFASVTYKE